MPFESLNPTFSPLMPYTWSRKLQLYRGCSTCMLPLVDMAIGYTLDTGRAKVERLLMKMVRMDYLTKDCPNVVDSVYKSELAPLDAIIFYPNHVFRPIFPPPLFRRPGPRKRYHPFALS